jgi:hypothetical protein
MSLPLAGAIACVAGARDAVGLGAMRDPLCAIGPRAQWARARLWVVAGRGTPVVRRRSQLPGLVMLRAAAPLHRVHCQSTAGWRLARMSTQRWGIEGGDRLRVVEGWTGSEVRADGGWRNGSRTCYRRAVHGLYRSRVRRAEEKREEGPADGRPECGSTRAGISRAVRGFSFGGCSPTSLPRLPPSRLLASRFLVCRSTFHTVSTPFHSPPPRSPPTPLPALSFQEAPPCSVSPPLPCPACLWRSSVHVHSLRLQPFPFVNVFKRF